MADAGWNFHCLFFGISADNAVDTVADTRKDILADTVWGCYFLFFRMEIISLAVFSGVGRSPSRRSISS